MRISIAVAISAFTLVLGFYFKQLYLWLPLSVMMAGLIDLFTRQWVMSDKLGRARTLSVLLKFIFALIGFYAMIGQVFCVAMIVWWFI